MIRFNGNKTIGAVVEQHTHGTISYGEVYINVDRTNDEVIIRQERDKIFLNTEQAVQLFSFLRDILKVEE